MEETNFIITEILNCISWFILTIALIIALFMIVKSHNEVKYAIKRKIDTETRLKENDYNTRKY